MKAKLIKKNDGYYHLDDPCGIIAFYSERRPEHNHYKLSLKNCQAIERGYDLDELATEFAEKRLGRKISKWEHVDAHSAEYSCFYHGFQKALELMGDKKFTEEDIRKAIEIARKGSMQEQHNGYGMSTGSRFILDNLPSDEIIQLLQQNEWEVEILMEEVKIGDKYTPDPKPKLDADGCLILKRVV